MAVLSAFALFAHTSALQGAPSEVRFSQSGDRLDAYDYLEITLNVTVPDARNPFTDVAVEGWFATDGGRRVNVDGFCDSPDGSVFRIRFMPTQAGRYDYSITYQQGQYKATHNGRFHAVDGGRKGIVRVDQQHPWHFLWEGTGEHCFYNGTTTYFLAGWDVDQIRRNLDRLARLKVNRVRAAIAGRVKDGQAWFENVYPTNRFRFLLNPWVAKRPDSVEEPGFDVRRFNVEYWRKWDKLLGHARERNLVVSVIFYVDGRRPGVDPFGKKSMGGEDEQRYYRYAVARFAAFSNVMWDVTNEYRLFRDDAWAEKMGVFIKKCDPYDHLTSVHGHGDFRFQKSSWADFAMYQRWDESGGYAFMLDNRKKQAATGRIMPQVNEEYGYEDHYPTWGGNRKPPARSADSRRRLAWGMYMAGGYQTNGERADTGTGWGPDTGGGWLNGRGDDSMTMFVGYGHIVDFFTSLPWWELVPDDDFFVVPGQDVVRHELTHVVYTRDKTGNATFFLDGKKQNGRTIRGDCSSWDTGFRLALANELTQDRPWLGELHRVAIHDRAFREQQVARNFSAGHKATPGSPVALFDFRRDHGNVIRDVSGVGKPLDLKISNISAVDWIPSGGLRVQAPVLIASHGAAEKVSTAVRKSGELTLEAWVAPANMAQSGPARIVTLSRDTGQRNFTLGQKGAAYEVRCRTTSTSRNGEPALTTQAAPDGLAPICGLRTDSRDLAVVYLPVGGSVAIKPNAFARDFNAQWYNPRTGEWSVAKATSRLDAPDEKDWVLLLRAN
ncbi:MAG: apiosidase-like domain-containing protein [Planctomycetota bacterium]|jgi:hypothetical protein